MTVFGYIRKDYPIETSVQIKQLMAHECQDLYIEKESLAFDEEQELLLSSLKKGDIIIVVSLATFGKRSNELQKIMELIVRKEVSLISLYEKINTNETYFFYEVLTAISRIDKKISGDKIKQKLDKLKDSGKQLGRPSIDEETVKEIRRLRYDEHLKLREIATKCDLSVGTIYKYIQ